MPVGAVPRNALSDRSRATCAQRRTEGASKAAHPGLLPLSAERRTGPQTHPIEDLVVTATILVGIICTAWFLMFGSPGVPVAP